MVGHLRLIGDQSDIQARNRKVPGFFVCIQTYLALPLRLLLGISRRIDLIEFIWPRLRMTNIYGIVFTKAAVAAVVSLVASFAISYVVVPMLGGELNGAGLIMTLALPVVIAFPASAIQFWQFETARRLRDELATALVQIDDVNTKLMSANLELVAERSHDPVTRLHTAEIFRQRLSDQGAMPDIGQLVLVRIDRFGQLRKSHGQALAETAVFAVAASIRRSLRPVDFAGRLDDQDFAIFMPGSTPILASLAMGSISTAVASVLLPYDGEVASPTTISVGGLECAPGFGIDAALEAAGEELENSVAQGGNSSHWGKLRIEAGLSRSAN